MNKRVWIAAAVLMLAAALFLSACSPVSGTQPLPEKSPAGLTIPIREINKHGNLLLDTSFEAMNAGGIEIGDLITVLVGDESYEMPVGTSYTDVDSGEMICRFDLEDGGVALAINYGSFASVTGVAEKQTIEEEPGYRWDAGVQEVTVSLKEKKGYLDEYNARNLTRTDAREDYPGLSDEEFANFRAVSVTGLRADTLYRSSTPIEPALGRNEYAMAAMERAGIRTVINLADSVEAMTGCAAYPGSYYSGCAIVNPEMSYDCESEEFGGKIRESVLFLTENEGPYLVHCKEGKDRTGIVCAILECFAGATAEEVRQDYMLTYRNYYNVQESDAAYGIILNNNLVKTLCGLWKLESLDGADLKACAANYLRSVGLTEGQLNALAEKLT